MIVLRTYQEKALKEVKEKFVDNKEVVLSIAPGGGKTEVSLVLIQELLKENKKVLVLSHGTDVLRTNWIERCDKYNIEYSLDFSTNLTINLPQALKGKKMPKVDLLIVDEAHEFYFAEKLIPEIIKKTKPKKQLLLTGTPSKFIADVDNKKPIVVISGVEVYNEGFLEDTYFGLVRSDYKIKDEDFNSDKEVNNTFNFSNKDTKGSLEELIVEMCSRLNVLNIGKNNVNWQECVGRNLAKKFAKQVFNKMEKTLIAARNINQANLIGEILKKYNVDCVVSNSENDVDSKSIEIFKTSENVRVLVVVRRGVLGFDMPELCNVVDFTGSRNIDRIYQLYARVLRPCKGKKKFFFRLVSRLNPTVDSICLQAALSLNNEDFIKRFNGKNLNGMEIIVPRRLRTNTSEDREPRDDIDISQVRNRNHSFDMILVEELLSLKLLSKASINGNSDFWNEFEYAKFGKVIEKLTGKEFIRPIVNITEENLRYMIETGLDDERIYG